MLDRDNTATRRSSPVDSETRDIEPSSGRGTSWTAAELVAVGLLLAACSALWNYLGALLHPDALTYSHAFFGQDIQPTYYAAQQILRGHGPAMFDPTVVHGYTYSPFFAWLFTPLALLPWAAAANIWYVLCSLWLWLAIVMVVQVFEAVLPNPLSGPLVAGRPLIPILAAVWLGIPPSVQATLDFGQVDYLILALLTGAVVCLLRRRDGLAGVLIVSAALLKITPIGLLLVFIVFRRWRALVGGLLTLLACVVVTSLDPRVGIASWVRMSQGVNANLSFIFAQYANESVGSIFAHVLALVHHHVSAQRAEYVGILIAAILFLAALALGLRRDIRESPRWIIAAVASIGALLLASPLNWDHTYVVAAIPAAVLLGLTATRWLATHHVGWRDIVGVLSAAILAAWPMTAALSVAQSDPLKQRISGIVLLSARPAALLTITCLLLFELWHGGQWEAELNVDPAPTAPDHG